MQEELKQLHTEINSAFEDFKKLNDAAKEERSKFGEESALLKEQIGKVNDRLDEIEVKQTELKSSTPEVKDNRFREWLRDGTVDGRDVRELEVKAMDLTDSSTGFDGILQNDEYLAEIQKGVVEFSPVRQFARVLSIGTSAVDIPRRTTTAGAGWIGETATRSETTNPDYDLVNIPAYELYARADISRQLLEDAEFDTEAEMAMEFGEQFGVAEGAAFLTGDGSNKPLGMLDDTDGVTAVSAGDLSGDTLAVEDLFNLAYSVKGEYARNGAWMINRETLPLIRQFETSAGGYIWQPSLAPSDPSTIMGYPYVEATDLDAPSAGAFSDSDKVLVFGDYRRAYTIVDRVGVEIQRDPFTLGASGQVRYIARKRVGGKPMIQEAAAYLQFA